MLQDEEVNVPASQGHSTRPSARTRRRSDPTGRRRFGLVLASGPALWFLLLLITPLAILLTWSFQRPGIGVLLHPNFSVGAYGMNLGAGSAEWGLIRNTLLIALLVGVVSVALGYPIAYVLAFIVSPRRRYALLLTLTLPFLTSYLLRLYAWRLILGNDGILNRVIITLGIAHTPLNLFLFSRAAVIIVLVYVWAPWAALPLFVRLEQIEPALLEAAADLGARPWRSFRRVVFPLSIPGVVTAFFFVFIPTLGDFVTAQLVGGTSGVMVGTVIQNLLEVLDYPSGAVLSVLLVAVSLAAIFIGVRFMRARIWVDGD